MIIQNLFQWLIIKKTTEFCHAGNALVPTGKCVRLLTTEICTISQDQVTKGTEFVANPIQMWDNANKQKNTNVVNHRTDQTQKINLRIFYQKTTKIIKCMHFALKLTKTNVVSTLGPKMTNIICKLRRVQSVKK